MHRAQVASLGLLAPGAEAMKCAPDSCGVGVHSPISEGERTGPKVKYINLYSPRNGSNTKTHTSININRTKATTKSINSK